MLRSASRGGGRGRESCGSRVRPGGHRSQENLSVSPMCPTGGGDIYIQLFILRYFNNSLELNFAPNFSILLDEDGHIKLTGLLLCTDFLLLKEFI